MSQSTLDDEEIDHPEPQTTQPRFIKDPIHDYIPIDHRVSNFIDTKQFQRLRNIKQLGTSYYVWPGASHNRFEHCVGVAYLSRLFAEHLRKNQPELHITDRDVKCVELAGLCHDLGHGPWSHVWDGQFIPVALKGRDWTHEQGSEMMFDYLIEDKGIKLSPKDADFIKALIAGEPSKCSDDEKPFLFDIVANKRNGIDVDKFDYIARDSHMVGDQGNLSLNRLIQSARVIDNQICYDIKDANQIHEICYTRFRLHKMIYNHKTAKAIEYMIIDALLLADPHMHIAKRVDQPEKYLHLTDAIMLEIEASEHPELAPSRAIFDRIRTRDLYKCVDYKVIKWEHRELFRMYVTPEQIVEAAKSLPAIASTLQGDDDGDSFTNVNSLEPQHVIVDQAEMHYGMKEKNPLDFVRFYSKNKPNQCEHAQPGDYSMLMPSVFAEVLLRVYTRDAQFFGIVQAGYRAVLDTINDRVSLILPVPELMNTLTPTEAPSTPRAQSHNASLTLSEGSTTNITTPLSFPINSFTTVPPTFVPNTPMQKNRTKREHGDDGANKDGSPVKKRRG